MKIALVNDCGQSAHFFQRLGLARAFNACGHEAVIWDLQKQSEFDFFDTFEPDLLIGQTNNVNSALIKCIKQRPMLKVLLKASDYGYMDDKTEKDSPIVRVTEEEKALVQILQFYLLDNLKLCVHYHPDYLNFTHDGWGREGYDVLSSMNAADTFEYSDAKFMEEYSCDISYVGGFWPYKARTLNKYLYPLCSDFRYRIKIAGNSHHPVPQYIGPIPPGLEKNFYHSSKINFSMSEPHSRDFGYDVTEKFAKIACSKGFFISDYVEGLDKMFGEDIVMVKSPNEVKDLVEYFLSNKEVRERHIEAMYKKVMEKHTYFDRVSDILDLFGLKNNVKEVKNEYIGNW